MGYRSNNSKFMDKLQKVVLFVTKGYDKVERKFALDFLRSHVKLDDLHQEAIKTFPNKAIEFGQGSLNPRFVIVTKDPIDEKSRELLVKVLQKARVGEDEIYFAHLRFIKTKKKQAERKDIFDRLLSILKPKQIISFDGTAIADGKYDSHVFSFPASRLLDKASEDERKQITVLLKEIRKSLTK